MILVRLWRSIAEPRHLKIAFLIGYLVTIYMGSVTFCAPPASVEGELGVWLTKSMAIFLTSAGLIGTVTVLPGWWATERLGIYSAYVGLAIYAGVAITLQITSSEGSRLTQIGAILLAVLLFIVRQLLIRKHDFEPRG
ncbi:MAG: hypothetical protein ABWX92_09870 [Mycetocola sp.]